MQNNSGGAAPGLGTRLRKWRKRIPIKSYELAGKIKISQGSLSDIENNKSLPSADTITKLYNLTDINIIWLLTGKEGDAHKGVTPADQDPPFVITMNPRVKKVLIKYEE